MAGILILIHSQLSALWAIERVPFSRWLLFETVSCVASAALVLWGWSRMRRAKAARPDLSWPQFLRHDLIAIGIGVTLLGVLVAMPRELRDDLDRWLVEYMHQLHQLHLSKGGP